VCNAVGIRFAIGILNDIRSIQQSSSKGPSAKQERPSNPTWAIWRQLLHLVGDKHLLHRDLGPWHMAGPTMYSREYRKLFHHRDRHYDVSPSIRHGIFSFTPKDQQSEVLADSIPVNATKAFDGWYVIYPNPSLYPQETVTFMLTSGDYVDTLPDYDAMLIYNGSTYAALTCTKRMPPFYPAPLSFLSAMVVPTIAYALLGGSSPMLTANAGTRQQERPRPGSLLPSGQRLCHGQQPHGLETYLLFLQPPQHISAMQDILRQPGSHQESYLFLQIPPCLHQIGSPLRVRYHLPGLLLAP
jgi:hypothetical protein